MSTRILIVRTSSLGDLVHMLPAMSDIARHLPDAHIDWLAEEAFAEIPAWHPAIREVIPVAHRRWRKQWWSSQTRAERKHLKHTLDSRQYDVVLDMQALMKSIWLVRQTRGTRHGLDWRSAREPLASLFYDVRHRVEFWQPAIIRQRTLAGKALGYTPQGEPDFGLHAFTAHANAYAAAPNYAVIMASASRDDKLWPDAHWHQVFRYLHNQGLELKLLTGNATEHARARRLLQGCPQLQAQVLPRLNLTETARVLATARIMVGLDSGLTHLSAALGRPTIGIYKASTPVRTPLQGSGYTASLGERSQEPDARTVLSAMDRALQSR